jgi:hypothetical protein
MKEFLRKIAQKVLLGGMIKDLRFQVYKLERALFEAQSFEQLGAEKLKIWVEKHDELLIKFKELKKKYGEE